MTKFCHICEDPLDHHSQKYCDAVKRVKELEQEIHILKQKLEKKEDRAYIPSKDLDYKMGGKRVDMFD